MFAHPENWKIINPKAIYLNMLRLSHDKSDGKQPYFDLIRLTRLYRVMANLIKNSLLAVSLMVVLQACGGRIAHPVMKYNALDTSFSCEHFKAEFRLNEQKFLALSKEEETRDLGNAAQLVLGSPLLLDLTTTIDKERDALQTRNEEISRQGQFKNCSPFETNVTASIAAAKRKNALAKTEDLFPTL